MKKLTRRQQEVFETILHLMKEQEYPPTIKELTERLGAASRNTAVKHLAMLDRKGYIEWKKNTARGIKVLEHKVLLDSRDEWSLPLVGAVTAGIPMLAEENIERYMPVPKYLLQVAERHFLLRVRGESMRNAGILNGDLVVVRSQLEADIGDIVVALLETEATVKRLAVKEGQCYLKAENPAFSDIYPEREWSIQGKVVALMRETVV